MTQPPVPPGSPPPPGSFPPPAVTRLRGYYPPGWLLPAGAFRRTAPQAYTSWITRVVAYFIDVLPVVVLFGIGMASMFVTGENDCVTISGDQGIQRQLHL